MLDEPPLIVRMRGSAGFMDDSFVILQSASPYATLLKSIYPRTTSVRIRAPEKGPEIARPFFSSRRRPVDSVELGERLERKIRNKSSFKHAPVGNSLQDRAVFSVVCIRHHVTFL